MRFLFASEFRHLPQKFGGVQSSTHELALELVRRGHTAAVAAQMMTSDFLGIRTRLLGKIIPKKKVHDTFLGYPTYRRWNVLSALPDLVEEIRPDVAIAQPFNQVPLARELIRLSVPTIVYSRDVEWSMHGGDPRDIGPALFLSNSQFTARRFREAFDLESIVLRPLFRASDYQSNTRHPDNVTFINPHKLKGGELAVRIVASCPDIPFCFVRSWELPDDQEQWLRGCTKTYRNLTIRRPTRRMRDIYARAKILLMPSQWEEAWGRVASEAQFSGIPVVASNRGGLPEAVGPGGILLDPDGPVDPWVNAIRQLWQDDRHYAALSAAALAHSTRPDLNPDRQIETLLAAAEQAIRQRTATAPQPSNEATEY